MLQLTRGGSTASTENSGDWVSLPENRKKQLLEDTLTKSDGQKIGGVASLGDLPHYPVSSRLTTALTYDFAKAIDNFRIQRMLAILPAEKKTMATVGNIPKNKSMFSCERYQFLLDAPFDVSHMCCNVMKKSPIHRYCRKTGRVGMTGQMASESRLRTQQWLRNGCNGFNLKVPLSNPMSFWTEQDVLLYIYLYKIPIAAVYGDVVPEGKIRDEMIALDDLGVFELERPVFKTTGCERTGCVFCGFGCHREKPGEGRFERLKETHPQLYKYIMKPWDEGGLGYTEVIDWLNENGNLNIKY
jgi:3'-phosphoadenosine 5'-phosphosulfate sulfotransferase (PAPS reductase)/FAD synthetase